MIDLVQSTKLINLNYSKLYHVKILRPKNQKELRKQKNQEINIIEPVNNSIARTALETKKTDILLSPEKHAKKDFMHQRDSGLNHILCKLAKKNKIAVGINFSELLNEKHLEKRLGRIMQNIKLCRKFKIPLVLASFANNRYEQRNPKDLELFAQVIGMTPTQAKISLNFKKQEKTDIKVIK